jgi:P4 family phage/plasmid primase-like protien
LIVPKNERAEELALSRPRGLQVQAHGTSQKIEGQAASVAFARRWKTEERGIPDDAGELIPLPPRVTAETTAFLGGTGEEVANFLLLTYDEDEQPRPDLSRTRWDAKDKRQRYRSPAGIGCHPYAPRRNSYAEFNAAKEKHIAEGEGKTMALVGTGRVVLGIGGVWNWRGPDGHLLPSLAVRVHPGDVVTLWIDGDWRTNAAVHRGAYLLLVELRSCGAEVLLVDLPVIPGSGKVGIDDLIKLWRDRGEDVEANLAQLPRLEEVPSPFAVDLKKPLDTAENFIAAYYTRDDGKTLVHWQSEFYLWIGRGWERRAEELLRQELYGFIRANGVAPTKNNVSVLLDALRAAAQIELNDAPAWIGSSDLSASDLLPCANGLLHIATRELLPPTPAYFNLNWSDVAYNPAAPCPRWISFVSQVYPDDPQARDCLQEFMGYSLTDDTSQQKAIALIGAKRSGKGTIARVLQALVGRSSCCSPTLQSMGDRFGMQTWIGKKVAVVADARASVKNNAQAMVERVLTVTGEDTQYVDRKHIEPWEGRLRVRLWLLSNMLPATQDKGAALSSRFLILNHTVSFYGREDTGLEAALEAEHSGILNWTLDGLEQLRERGQFHQPESGRERAREWERMNSPVLTFVQDCCELGAGVYLTKLAMRSAFQTWCAASGVQHLISDAHFTEELKAATEQRVTTGQRTVEGKRQWVFVGLRLTAGRY